MIRTQHFLTALIMGMTLFFSCEEEDNVQDIGNWELQPASIGGPAADANIVLDSEDPSAPVRFEWNPASNDQGYFITYRLVLDEADGDFSQPLFSEASGSNGTALFIEISARTLDQVLAKLGLPVSESIALQWGVEAISLSKTQVSSQPITLTRFDKELVPDQLFMAGTSTEVGNDVANAIPMIDLTDAEGLRTNVFELYTSLTSGETFNFYTEQGTGAQIFGGNSGELLNAGAGIVAPETGQYRIRADFNNATYEFLKIDRWSIVGNVIDGGWGGDAPLQYQGGSVWNSVINLQDADPGDDNKRFVFRANGDWGVVFKRIQGTENEVIFEAFANENGYALEDVPVSDLGRFLITLDLSAPTPSYTLEEDNSAPTETPAALYLFADGSLVTEFEKNGDVFSYAFIDLGTEVVYTLNDQMDGTGNAYNVLGSLGDPGSEASRVNGSLGIGTGSAALTISENQAYRLSFDFSTATVVWDYYNFKLFHWQQPDGWDARNEFLMTYVGNYTWEVTETLTSGYDSKFISPWDFDFGSESPTELTGNMTAGGGSNFTNLAESGAYHVTITLDPGFATGSYEFVKQ